MSTFYNTLGQNGVSYIQDNLTTHGGVQYAVFSDGDRHPIIAKRTLPDGDWAYFDLSVVAGNPLASPTVDDVHNNYVVAVDLDGYIHVSGNHHDHPLRYVRSLSPGDITGWEAPGMVGTEENSVTYPQFLHIGTEFLFIYRNGSSGNGAAYINVYNHTSRTWSRRSKPLSGLLADGVNPDESPYTNRLTTVAPDGTWHWFFMWRETSDVASSHDLCHMKSTDNGATFTNITGTALTLPVTPSTSPIIKAGWNYAINQSGACVDSQGRPHAAWWLRESYDNNTPRLVHFWHDGTNWHEDSEHKFASGVVETINLARPLLFPYGDRVFAVYSLDHNDVRTRWWLHDITPSPTARIHRAVILDGRDLGRWEPSHDARALADRGELHMLITPIGPDYAAGWGAVVVVDMSAVS